MNYGFLCLIPPVIIIITAIFTKSTVLSLLLGVLTSCFIQSGTGVINSFIDLVYSVGCNADTVWYAFFVILFACMLGMWQFTGSTNAIAIKLRKYATSQKKTMVLSWLIGTIVFVDDFTSIAVNSTMTKLFDKHKIPRAMLTYIADSTASPICILVPFGTWAIFYQSVFSGYSEVTSLGSTISTYIKMIPSLFYGWAALIIPLLVALGIIKPLGAMKKAWDRANTTGELYSKESALLNKEEDSNTEEAATMKQVFGFLIPLVVFIIEVFVTGDVIIASIWAIIIMVPYFLITKLAGVKDMVHASIVGIQDMVEMILIVILAYMLRDSLVAMGMPEFIVSTVAPFTNPQLLPLITFIVCSFLTFTSGSNWGATVAAATILIPLCSTIGGNMIYVLSAIVSGAAFGAHACFYCDVTVLTSAMTKIDNMEHAITQLPYSLIGFVISTIGYLVVGLI